MSEYFGVTGFPLTQEYILVTSERVASVISVIGCFFVMFTFLWSSRFRKPVNRLIFYATWGNLICNVGTLISVNGMQVGYKSPLCQFQGFLIQSYEHSRQIRECSKLIALRFLPADALWNLAMAINTYLTVFKRYNAAQCRAMEKWYLLVNFGICGLIAFVYCFISNGDSKVYGGAVLWCWVRRDWHILRLLTCYGPAWYVQVAMKIPISQV